MEQKWLLITIDSQRVNKIYEKTPKIIIKYTYVIQIQPHSDFKAILQIIVGSESSNIHQIKK